MIEQKITDIILRALKKLGVPSDMVKINLEHPADLKFGDYSTNVAMLLFKQLGATAKSPLALAEKIAEGIKEEIKEANNPPVSKVEAVGVGFINFHLSKKFLKESVFDALDKTVWFGKGNNFWNKKIIIEHTNLNPFKPFHVGHLVNNSIGESLTRLLEFQDAKLVRASYGGDIGLHVAKTLWSVMAKKTDVSEFVSAKDAVAFLGKSYAEGNAAYEKDYSAQEEIKTINKKLFDKSDKKLNELYEWGRSKSLEYFAELYKRLNTKIDHQFFESEVAEEGLKVVRDFFEHGIFVESEGAIIFKGEDYGLHNRVFITSQGLPTYEAKEMGLTRKKFELDNFDLSLVVTANEQNDYFEVILKTLSLIYPEIARRTKHLGHGIMRLSTGKMSTRSGTAFGGEEMIAEIEKMVADKIKDKDYSESDKQEIIERVSLGAIRYSILKQSIGKDIIFDPEKSISFEGDSGPYLQYTYVRTRSVLEKAEHEGLKPDSFDESTENELPLERLVYRFPGIVKRAAEEYAPQFIATYLIELAGEFNRYYAKNQIIDKNEAGTQYRIALTDAVRWILKNGLYLLGIQTPTKM